jgi:hypothetical protein
MDTVKQRQAGCGGDGDRDANDDDEEEEDDDDDDDNDDADDDNHDDDDIYSRTGHDAGLLSVDGGECERLHVEEDLLLRALGAPHAVERERLPARLTQTAVQEPHLPQQAEKGGFSGPAPVASNPDLNTSSAMWFR